MKFTYEDYKEFYISGHDIDIQMYFLETEKYANTNDARKAYFRIRRSMERWHKSDNTIFSFVGMSTHDHALVGKVEPHIHAYTTSRKLARKLKANEDAYNVRKKIKKIVRVNNNKFAPYEYVNRQSELFYSTGDINAFLEKHEL